MNLRSLLPFFPFPSGPTPPDILLHPCYSSFRHQIHPFLIQFRLAQIRSGCHHRSSTLRRCPIPNGPSSSRCFSRTCKPCRRQDSRIASLNPPFFGSILRPFGTTKEYFSIFGTRTFLLFVSLMPVLFSFLVPLLARPVGRSEMILLFSLSLSFFV